jgi:hypothetical protein
MMLLATAVAIFEGIANAMFSTDEEETLAFTMPTSFPSSSKSPPPLLPGFTAVSILMTRVDTVEELSGVFIARYSESTLTIPEETDIPIPSGFPIAIAV